MDTKIKLGQHLSVATEFKPNCASEYKNWRNLVFTRDQYTCQVCGQYGGYLIAHHHKPYVHNRDLCYDVNNGLTLCQKCHFEKHRRFRWVTTETGYYNKYIPTMCADKNGEVYGGAIGKQVKVGGSFYKGYKLVVGAAAGDYLLDMTYATPCVINGITVIPEKYGAGDYFKLEHLSSADAVKRTIVETVYNVGANAAWLFDLVALEKMDAGDKFRLTYTNVAGTAMNLYTNVERIR